MEEWLRFEPRLQEVHSLIRARGMDEKGDHAAPGGWDEGSLAWVDCERTDGPRVRLRYSIPGRKISTHKSWDTKNPRGSTGNRKQTELLECEEQHVLEKSGRARSRENMCAVFMNLDYLSESNRDPPSSSQHGLTWPASHFKASTWMARKGIKWTLDVPQMP